MNTNSLSVLHLPQTEKFSLLSRFSESEHEYWIFQLNCTAADIDELLDDFTEFEQVSRFQINQHCCVVMRKISDNNDDIHQNLMHILSNRELQIATLIAMGCPNKQVARKLHISEWTVATHLRRIFAKLRVETRAAMIYHCASLIQHQDKLSNR